MAAVYKALSKANAKSPEDDESKATGARKNRQRVLLLTSRGTSFRDRHFVNDLTALMPHARRDVKFDSKTKLYQLNELATIYNCNNVLFFEARKGKDLYAWISKPPNGPTVKFLVQNVHTMEDLRFTGNCLKGSRPVLSFDAAFESHAHLKLIRELFLHVFGVPQGTRKSKPFIDHVMAFSIIDGKIWIRNYEIKEVEASKTQEADKSEKTKDSQQGTDINLVEIGPRWVFTPIIIQEGSFGGPIIFENKQYVSPNQVRSDLRKQKAARHRARAEQQVRGEAKKEDLGLQAGGRKPQRNGVDVKALFS